MRHLAIIALSVLLISGCESIENIEIEKINEGIKEKSAEIQTSVTDTIESKKIEAEKLINDKKNELLQDVIDDIKDKTDVDLNKDSQ